MHRLFWLVCLSICLSVYLSHVQAERHPVGGNKKMTVGKGRSRRRGRGGGRGEAGARHRPSAPASPGRAAGARGSGRRRGAAVALRRTRVQAARPMPRGRCAAAAAAAAAGMRPLRLLRTARCVGCYGAATGRSTVLCLSLSPSLAGPRRPSSPRAAPRTGSAPSLNCFERLSSDLICEDADYVRRALPPLAHITPLPRHGDARAVTRTCSLRTDAKADVLARATGT